MYYKHDTPTHRHTVERDREGERGIVGDSKSGMSRDFKSEEGTKESIFDIVHNGRTPPGGPPPVDVSVFEERERQRERKSIYT